MSVYAVPVGAAIWVKFVQPALWQRSTRYPVTPALSVEALQVRLTCVVLTAVAVRFVGVDGTTPTAVFMSDWICAAVSAVL